MDHTHRRIRHQAVLSGLISAVVALPLLAGCTSGEELRAAPAPVASPPDATATVTVTVTAPAPGAVASPGTAPAAPGQQPSPGLGSQPSSTPAAAATGSGRDPNFLTCEEAIAAGFGPYRRGVDPEYAWYPDNDGDGVVCDR